MAEALSHLRAVELCDDLQGAYCGKQFAAWGASVAVVEPPDGHGLRRSRPLALGKSGEQVSLLWEYLAGRKRSMLADPAANPADAGRVRQLIDTADVFVTDWKPERLRSAGLDYESVRLANPRLVFVHLSPFGLTGPYAGFEGTDLIAQALSGFCSFNGYPDREPVKIAANVLAFACGVEAFIGAMAAIRERRLSGVGQMVEVSHMETIATIMPYLRIEYYGQQGKRNGTTGPGNDTYKLNDGYVYFSLLAERAWGDFILAMSIDPETVPEALRTQEGRAADRAAMRAWVTEQLKARPALEIFHLLNTFRMTTGIILTPEQLAADPHLRARGFLHEVAHPNLRRLTIPGASGQMSETPMASSRPAPQPGTGTADWGPVDHADDKNGASREAASTAPPLRGLRVLDLTAAWIGTYATMLLADMGAEVIKIESPKRPDVWRGADAPLRTPPMARPSAHPWNLNVNFNSVNRNKLSTCLDLDTDEGKALFLRLAAKADLVMENYTPRVMANFGLGYDDLRKVKDDVIMVSFSGFGATGPYSDYRAIGASTEMQGGWDALHGYPDREPIMLGAMFADAITGLQMAAMTLTALEHRSETGHGQRVEGGMFEAAVSYIGEEVMRAALRPGETSRRANRHLDIAPHGVYRCLGDDRWIAIVARDDAEWRRLLEVAGPSAGLGRPEFATAAGRLKNAEGLDDAISAWTADKDARALMQELQAVAVPAGVVQDMAEAMADEQFKAREWFIPMSHPDLGTHRYNGFAWRFSRSTCVANFGSQRLGESSREVLATELGLTEDEIDGLFAAGVTGQTLERAPAEAPAAS